MHWIRQAPVTSEMLVLCVALFACCAFQAMVDHVPLERVQRDWGAVRERVHVESYDGIRRTPDGELRGPLDVWDGEFWRIPLAAFHHRNLVHLLICGALALYLGRFVEDEWGSFSTIVFLIPATSVPIMAELAVGHSAMGLSGTVCALFGAVCMMRTYDEKLSQAFGPEKVALGAVILLLCFQATVSELVRFPNVSHLAGLIYGGSIAFLFQPALLRSDRYRAGILLLHLGFLPIAILLSHPVWLGPYHWYQASQVRDPELRDIALEQAVVCDPQLIGAWLRLSQVAEERGDVLGAWNRLIRGLKANPVSVSMMDSTRRLWRHFDSAQRRQAELNLTGAFGKRSSLWLQAIKSPAGSGESLRFELPSAVPESLDLKSMALDQKIEIFPLESGVRPELRGKPVDGDDPGDAAEGRTL